MDPEIFKDTMAKIQEKVGEETAAIIADDLGTLRTAQKAALDKQSEYEKKIEDLTTTNQQLVASNANLLNKIPVIEENKVVPNTQNNDKGNTSQYNPMDAFDQFGRLKK